MSEIDNFDDSYEGDTLDDSFECDSSDNIPEEYIFDNSHEADSPDDFPEDFVLDVSPIDIADDDYRKMMDDFLEMIKEELYSNRKDTVNSEHNDSDKPVNIISDSGITDLDSINEEQDFGIYSRSKDYFDDIKDTHDKLFKDTWFESLIEDFHKIRVNNSVVNDEIFDEEVEMNEAELAEYKSNEKFEKIENKSVGRGGGGIELACISRLLFYTGINCCDIPELKVSAVIFKENNIYKVRDKIDNYPFTLPPEVRDYLLKYLDVRIKSKIRIFPNSCLFNKYSNATLIINHLIKFNTKPSELRNCGIILFYLKAFEEIRINYPQDSEYDVIQKAESKTANQFDISTLQVSSIMKEYNEWGNYSNNERNVLKYLTLLNIIDNYNIIDVTLDNDQKLKLKSCLEFYNENNKYSVLIDNHLQIRGTDLNTLKQKLE